MSIISIGLCWITSKSPCSERPKIGSITPFLLAYRSRPFFVLSFLAIRCFAESPLGIRPRGADAEPMWAHAFFGGLFDIQVQPRAVSPGSDRDAEPVAVTFIRHPVVDRLEQPFAGTRDEVHLEARAA